MRPYFIGIAGPSGSGKSELSRRLADLMPGAVSVFPLDSYYLPLDHLTPEQRAARNFDHPDSLDWALAFDHLDRLARGLAAAQPVYLFDQHTRSSRSVIILPARYVIVEGILALHPPGLRRRLDLKVYVDTPDEVCRARRLERDVVCRGRTKESVERQYEETVRPMAARFVWPSRAWADLVVSGVQPIGQSVEATLAKLRN